MDGQPLTLIIETQMFIWKQVERLPHIEIGSPGLQTVSHPCKLDLAPIDLDQVSVSQVSDFIHITVGDHELAFLQLWMVPG